MLAGLGGSEPSLGLTALLGDSSRKPVDVSPLAKLPKLARLELHGPVRNVGALATLANLRDVTIGSDVPESELEALRAKGMTVSRS